MPVKKGVLGYTARPGKISDVDTVVYRLHLDRDSIEDTGRVPKKGHFEYLYGCFGYPLCNCREDAGTVPRKGC